MAFEGVEASGKSTQIQLVAAALRELGVEPIVTREPGGTPAGEAIRAVALDNRLQLDPMAELLLMLAARAVFVRQIVRPALEAGRVVLTDRYELSSFAYQGGGRELGLEVVGALNDVATGGLRPDLCLLLDIDVEDGLRRRRDGATDRIEEEDIHFHRRVVQAYRALSEGDPDVASINGRVEIERVFAQVWAALSERLPETFPPHEG